MFKVITFCKQRPNCASIVHFLNTTSCYSSNNVSPPSNLKNFTPVYKFPYIRAIGVVNRLKFYHTAFTAAAIPTSLILQELGVIHPEAVMLTTAIGLTGCLSLFTVGIFTDKFVGFIYMHKEENIVRIAYVDFWGRRRDEEVPVKDIVPFSEMPSSFLDGLYLKLGRFSAKNTMKISVRLGQILDEKKFKKVFAIE